MPQFYFLSVVINFLAGAFLFLKDVPESDFDADASSEVKPRFFSTLLNQPWLKLSLGVACFVVGIIKIFLPFSDIPGSGGILLIGDLLPVLIGLALGTILFFDFLKENSSISSALMDKIKIYLLDNDKYFGIAGMACAVLHFFFPGALIL